MKIGCYIWPLLQSTKRLSLWSSGPQPSPSGHLITIRVGACTILAASEDSWPSYCKSYHNGNKIKCFAMGAYVAAAVDNNI